MLTRGTFIGEIIDELTDLAERVRMRNALGFTDLSVHSEIFFRDFLNILLGAKLQSLNKDRSNEPGLDLGDPTFQLGIQVTGTASAAKVNKTLEKITPDQMKAYPKVLVLVVGRRQGSYQLDPALATKHSFSEDDIWDMTTLARRVVELELEPLQRLHQFVRANAVRLKVELEVPDSEGNYPTNGYAKWEAMPTPKAGDGKKFIAWWEDDGGSDLNSKKKAEIAAGVELLGRRLASLPRVTREFLVMLYEQRERGRSKRFPGTPHVVLEKAKRRYLAKDFDDEVAILDKDGFLTVSWEDPYEQGPVEIGLRIPSGDDYLSESFFDYMEKKKLSFRTIVGGVDLSDF